MDRIDTGILKITDRIIGAKIDGGHGQAVQAQVAFAREIFVGLLLVCGARNGLSGESLLRTLFEVVTSGIILAKHPEKLERFIRHARFTGLRVTRSVSAGRLGPKIQPYIAATEQEFRELLQEFRNERWHGFGTKAAFIEAEFDPSMYDKYYRFASVIAHGQPYVTVGAGNKVRPRMKNWKALSTFPSMLGRLLMLTLLTTLVTFVDIRLMLYLVEELEELDKQLRPLSRRHIDRLNARVDEALESF
ncbi:MAG TPA: DUF5677 domain-containing protein [Chthoniobacterales bacterium]|nr:DUF5677 domain-containing protein [Chthoniobacterales bacterium]